MDRSGILGGEGKTRDSGKFGVAGTSTPGRLRIIGKDMVGSADTLGGSAGKTLCRRGFRLDKGSGIGSGIGVSNKTTILSMAIFDNSKENNFASNFSDSTHISSIFLCFARTKNL
jgi:hypothetical protein